MTTIHEKTIDDLFMSGPGETVVRTLMSQLAAITGPNKSNPFQELFGPYKPGSNQQRWADYDRFDWSIRQLPAINVYEAESEEKTSSNGYLNGAINIMVLWPPSQRRSDFTRVPMAFQGAILNFFESSFCKDMLDELYYIKRAAKVPGLNEFGKSITWSPNIEGIVESETVPVTLISVKYRIDLRSWYRALEFQNRTKDLPYQATLHDLKVMGGTYDGVTDDAAKQIAVAIKEEFAVKN